MAGRRFQVVVTDFLNEPLDPESQILHDIADVHAAGAESESDLIGTVEDADALMLYHNIGLSSATIDRLQNCKLIVRCGVGYDNVDLDAARAKSIPVANVPDYGTEDVADSAIGMALALTRGILYLNSRLRAGLGHWSYEQVIPTHRIRGRVFGIVGLGRIGTAAALRAKALGMDVIFYDPDVPDGRDKSLGVQRAESLSELLSVSHVLSLHCPLTEQTNRMIDDTALDQMPDGSFLVNTARGAVVDPSAVVSAIETGKLAGAGIDVLPDEPPDETNPLVRAWRAPDHPAHHRVILNPHSAFYSEEGLFDMRISGAKACRAAILGEPVRNVVS